MSVQMLTRLRNLPTTPLEIDGQGIQHSIATYLAFEHASQEAYRRIMRSMQTNLARDPNSKECLEYKAIEDLIAAYTGIEPITHDMCPDSCVAFTGPFSELQNCPTCGVSRRNEAKLNASNGRLKVPAKTFMTIPIGPQLQALYRDPNSAHAIRYLYTRTQEVVEEYHCTQKISLIDDIAAGWDSLGAFLDGDIKENDIVIMASIDGAQLYKDKESNCWICIWVVLNLSPDRRYRKVHILPAVFIPGPKKPKNIDSFMVVGLHHLSALQKEGLQIWDASCDEVFHSDLYLLFTTGNGPGLTQWDSLVGHCGKNGCRLYCGIIGQHKDSHSHYYPALLCPHDVYLDSNHPDTSSFQIPLAGNQDYTANLCYFMASPNPTQDNMHRTETGISKPLLILGLDPMSSLGVPLCMTTDLMHLASNITVLFLDLWRGDITCMPMDDTMTWDWAVLQDEQVWKAHGQAVEDTGSFLPQSFDTRPHDIAEKLHSDYKTREFIMYMFGITPGILHGILPNVYWRNLCKLIQGFQTLSQHQVPHNDVLEACVLLASWEQEFEEICYQRRKDHLHFICPCVHQILHLGPETFQKGLPICTAQWMIERTIGNLKQEIRQPSNYLQNFAMEGLQRARVNALLAALPELDDSIRGFPLGAEDLGDGYALLQKCDKIPVLPSHGTMGAISQFLNSPVPIPKIFRWARLLLPNGQIACSEWQ